MRLVSTVFLPNVLTLMLLCLHQGLESSGVVPVFIAPLAFLFFNKVFVSFWK